MNEKGGRCDNFMEKERKDRRRRNGGSCSGVMICRTPGVYWIFSKKRLRKELRGQDVVETEMVRRGSKRGEKAIG